MMKKTPPTPRSAVPKKADTVARRIDFFRVIESIGPNGTRIPHGIKALMEAVAKIPFSSTDRYERESDGVYRFCHLTPITPAPGALHIQYCRTRRKAAPLIEEKGAFTTVKVPNGAGVCEIVNLVLFSDGTVGSEFNFYGPRTTTISKHIAAILPKTQLTWRLEHMLDPKCLDGLKNATKLSEIHVQITRENAKGLAGSALEDALKSLGNLQTIKDVTVKLSVDANNPSVVRQWLDAVEQLASSQAAGKFEAMKVRANTTDASGMELIDLFEDRIHSRVQVELDTGGGQTIDAQRMVAAIVAKREQLLSRLEKADTLSMRTVI